MSARFGNRRGPPARACAFTVSGGPGAPFDARRMLAERVGAGLDADLLDVVRLLLSEVVTNCVRHGGAADGGPVEVKASSGPGVVRVEVASAGPGFEYQARAPGSDATAGYGLYLVDALSARWGIDGGPVPSVWFEVESSFADGPVPATGRAPVAI